MLDIKVKFKNSSVNRILKGIEIDIKSDLPKAKENIGKIVTKQSKKYAPEKSGDLEKAIKYRVKGTDVNIYVPSTSKAGKYAYMRHNDKYKLGKKTKSKSKAGPQFIKRAIDDKEKEIIKEITNIFKSL